MCAQCSEPSQPDSSRSDLRNTWPGPDEQFRNTFVVLKEPKPAASAFAQNLESAELSPRLHGLIVSPGKDREGERFGSLLPRALAGEDPIAHGHGEVCGFGAIP
jgi:hypothetical protein